MISYGTPETMYAGEMITVHFTDIIGDPMTVTLLVDGTPMLNASVYSPLHYMFEQDTQLNTLWIRFENSGGAMWDVSCGNPGPGSNMVTIPDSATGGMFTVDTSIYAAPSYDAVIPDVVMEAGKTVHVYGQDASGEFYQVMLAGNFFWVPQGTIGPNPDAVWQGRALPTLIVE